MKIKEILDRLKTVYKVKNNKELSLKIGISYDTLNTWVKRNKIPYETLEPIVQNEQLSYDWLLKGNGEAKINQPKSLIHELLPSIKQTSTLESTEETITLNYYEDIYAAAGYGSTNGDLAIPPEPIQMGVNFLRTFFNVQSVQDLDIINVVGDSMEPFIHNGEKVIVERTHEASNNNIVIALVGAELYVKRLIKDPFGEWIKLTSENQYYEDIMITQDKMHKLKIIGIVRGRVRPF